MQETNLKKAVRDMEICNACRYCEGLCPVFPEITNYREFDEKSINYLANLCHNCKSCFYACQYAPPHEFDINVPKIFSEIRTESYAQYTFPTLFSKYMEKDASFKSVLLSLLIALVFFLPGLIQNPNSMFSVSRGEGSFFKIVSYELMTAIPSVISLYILLVLALGFKKFWNDMGLRLSELMSISMWKKTFLDVMSLKHLGGGGDGKNEPGCTHTNDARSNARRKFHHLVFYGFISNLVSTMSAAFYHHFLHLPSPYAFNTLPVILGMIGGVMMMGGVIGLYSIKRKADKKVNSEKTKSMEYAFLSLLFWINLSGMLLLFLRDSRWMALLLCIHLGFVFAFFLILPYSKFVHAWYRLAALLRYNKIKI